MYIAVIKGRKWNENKPVHLTYSNNMTSPSPLIYYRILIREIHHKILQNIDTGGNITGPTSSHHPMLPTATLDNHNKRRPPAINRFPLGACRHSGTEPLDRQRK